MSLKKRLLIALVSSGAGVTTTLASSYFTSGTVALPIKGANSPLPRDMMNCRMQTTGLAPTGMGMMSSMQVQNEFDYLTKMIPHHEEAIATAKLLKAGTNRPEMRKFADDIIRVQSDEIEKMQAWLNRWYPSQKAEVQYMAMMRDLTNLKGDALDRAFLEDMRMHHMGAIMMSQRLLVGNLAQHNEVKTLAQEIRTAQRNEIHQMQAWLQTWFGNTTMMRHRNYPAGTSNSTNRRFGMGGIGR
ncbi:DUF305 domain-containing protein [Aerosakkonema funiforme]|nr:DUF305 domain-containing protein [Aerosakkonema funiforme]